jgi:pimeloyl-ACP methyl ester carboxylesterase
MYSQPGALRCAFAVYKAFDRDAAENQVWVEEYGKCQVPALAFSGASSPHAAEAEEMVREMYENVEVAEVDESGHYLAEENPEDFVKKVLAFVRKHG